MKSDRAAYAVSQWKDEFPNDDFLAMELLGRLLEISQIVSQQHLQPLFASFGLHPGEFDVLATLRRAGSPYQLTPTQLFGAAMISSGGMTNRIDRLEKAGWVMRLPHPTDRRGTLVQLTDTGLTLINQILPVHLATEQSLIAGLSKDKQMALNELLQQLVAQLPESKA
ncbi:MarR family transcriptional regulator [Leeia sp. TBRC 13508]|uniref:MarR family transcriptional regulator n=1 Tax=Leeia speluncae TaxID=2884804 RepID=A0ABS8D7A6_9NEIS|nr:MarR family transcriptional regulator [Leeia speluncae]MCB6184069.1 MarR family transcriptional regulator [Leeia speluncae]